MEWYSITQLTKMLEIPDATIRRYVRQHGHHLQIKKKNKSYQVANISLPVLSKIRELYATAGMNTEQVDEALTAAHVPIIMTVEDVNDYGEQVAINVPEALSDLRKDVNELIAVNKILVQRMDDYQLYIENVLKVRDEQLMAGLRQLAVNREEKKKSWWKFW